MIMPRADRPVLKADTSWEAGAELMPVEAMPDEQAGELLLYYLARFSGKPHANLLCLARSADGCAWSKPDCGDGTNIVMRSSGDEAGWKHGWGEFMPTAVLREPGEKDPARRWKLLCWDRPDPAMPPGLCLAMSSDGLAWKPRFTRPVITGMNDAMSMIDAPRAPKTPFGGRYFIYQQTWKHNPALSTARDNLKGCHRRISIWTGSSFSNDWIGPVTVLEPDGEYAPDLQFYWLVPFKRDDGGYGGLLNCHHKNDQTMDVQLVGSSDGWTWRRENGRKPLLSPGAAGRFDCGSVIATARPVKWRDRVLLYYRGCATVHDRAKRYRDLTLPEPAEGIGLAEFSDEPMVQDAPAAAAAEGREGREGER